MKILIALQIDHINPKDKIRKRDWFRKGYDLSKIQLLCANCHAIKTYEKTKFVQ
ncbi:MAG TPA: HNH endonuclease [bacterium]|nr:HNH endonuclease [bacterium]